jgi:serine/threonine protein kinase
MAEGVESVVERQLRRACAELERRLRAGEACCAETLFAAYPLLTCQEDFALDLIYTEYITREELGQRLAPEEFYARFPHWKERLERQFSVHQWMQGSLPAGAGGDGPAPREDAPDVPHWLGRYELLEPVGQGSCGVIYKAWQHGLERLVAVKVLRPRVSRLREARQRFGHEARVMAALQHPHVMPVHDIGEHQGVIFFSMDFATGGSLAQRLGAAQPPPAAAALLETVARAVHYGHRQGVIHRDLKPSNILFNDVDQPLVSDFGLAVVAPRPEEPGGQFQLIGTPAYMAPEQLAGSAEPVSPATDVWALGVILYEVLAGRRPFQGGSLAELQEAVRTGEPPPLPDAGLDEVCRRCLRKESARRYASAQDLADELRRAAAG